MTYKEYIEDTVKNCMTVLSERASGELLDANHIRDILWQDDRVTGVISGFCTSVKGILAFSGQDGPDCELWKLIVNDWKGSAVLKIK